MKRLLLFFVCFGLLTAPMGAQNTACPFTANVSVQIATTGTVIAATDRSVVICGFVFTGSTAGTRVQIKSGTTNISPNYIIPAGGNVALYKETVTWTVSQGGAVTVTAGTGDVAGHITFGLQ